jgi:dTDP-4-dehydrorhamnose reductase
MMHKKVLILGANGLIGNGLTRYLQTRNISLFAVVRSPRKVFLKKVPFFYCKNLNSKKSINNIEKFIKKIQPDFVINCLGITKHIKSQKNKLLNVYLPSVLIKFKKKYYFNLIHITTDCVFDGKFGNYKETSLMNAKDYYGKSKILSDKNLLKNKEIIIIRTSAIGHEIKTKRGLLEWFLSRNKICYGYKKAFFSGLTTLELAKIIYKYFLSKKPIRYGIYNLSGPKISKFDLLEIIKKIYEKDILIKPDYKLKIDRSLDTKKFRLITKYKKSSWNRMLHDCRKFYKKTYV